MLRMSCDTAGVKLYHSARLGEEVHRPARPIVVSEYSVWRDDPHAQDVHFRVRCSKGTYIRSLAHDLVRCSLCALASTERITASYYALPIIMHGASRNSWTGCCTSLIFAHMIRMHDISC